MEASEYKCCFRHSGVQEFKCDCDEAFVCLSVSLCTSDPLDLSMGLYSQAEFQW